MMTSRAEFGCCCAKTTRSIACCRSVVRSAWSATIAGARRSVAAPAHRGSQSSRTSERAQQRRGQRGTRKHGSSPITAPVTLAELLVAPSSMSPRSTIAMRVARAVAARSRALERARDRTVLRGYLKQQEAMPRGCDAPTACASRRHRLRGHLRPLARGRREARGDPPRSVGQASGSARHAGGDRDPHHAHRDVRTSARRRALMPDGGERVFAIAAEPAGVVIDPRDREVRLLRERGMVRELGEPSQASRAHSLCAARGRTRARARASPRGRTDP